MPVLEIGRGNVEPRFIADLDGLGGQAQGAGARIFVGHAGKI